MRSKRSMRVAAYEAVLLAVTRRRSSFPLLLNHQPLASLLADASLSKQSRCPSRVSPFDLLTQTPKRSLLLPSLTLQGDLNATLVCRRASPPAPLREEVDVVETFVLPRRVNKRDYTQKWLAGEASLASEQPKPDLLVGPDVGLHFQSTSC